MFVHRGRSGSLLPILSAGPGQEALSLSCGFLEPNDDRIDQPFLQVSSAAARPTTTPSGGTLFVTIALAPTMHSSPKRDAV